MCIFAVYNSGEVPCSYSSQEQWLSKLSAFMTEKLLNGRFTDKLKKQQKLFLTLNTVHTSFPIDL